jgi:diadenosine tetraphosphatase ApaH/serine/threonine PP2A family protein phosphatase
MRIAVLSDVHGNLLALEAVLEALKPYDAIWQLGDVVGYGPQPDEVVALLARENALGVRGNHDSAAIGELDTESFNDDARAAVEWTASRIAPETRSWLAALPLLSVDAPFTMVHGSPRDPTWEYVYNSAIASANFPEFDTEHCLVGHTHVPLVFRARKAGGVETAIAKADSTMKLDTGRLMANPGSVGQPRDGDARAAWMLLDLELLRAEWRRTEYDVAGAQAAIRAARLPESLAERLQYGQ